MQRLDPFEQRARELAAEAGHDPGARIPIAGNEAGRTMPVWTTFRDAARAEQVAAQARSIEEQGVVRDGHDDAPPIVVFGEHEEQTLEQMRRCMTVGRVAGGVICADGHLGYAQPVGGVIAYEDQVSVSGVGYDIGCGNMAARLDTPYAAIADRIGTIMADVQRTISFGMGRVNERPIDHPLFDKGEAWAASGMEDFRQKARAQLGTVGSGNHYVDVFEDEAGQVWIGVHFGSRGLGHTTATRFLKHAGGEDKIHALPSVLRVQSSLGQAYLAGMELAGEYAYAGREWVVEQVRALIGGAVTHAVHNHHNYAWRERHGGRDLWVVRKGATPAFPGQEGFVGGSMGDDAVILEGVEGMESRAALYSTVHGAGRIYSRMRAKRELSREEMDGWLREKGVLALGGDLDESPMAYRRLAAVLAAQGETVRVKHVLRPRGVVMASPEIRDLYKD